ncbi:mannitol dehydrogenase-like protein [Tanacetum coccineum]
MAKAFGVEVIVFSTSPAKKQKALEVTKGTLDGVIHTVSMNHATVLLLNVLKPNGKLIVVGEKIIAGSMIGGLKDTQEMFDFAAKHGVTANVEMIPIDYVNTAMDRISKSDVRYQFVIDVAHSLSASLSF